MSRAICPLALSACAATHRAPPPPASTVDDLIALLDASGERACSCTDRFCTETVENDLAAAIAGSHVPARWIEDSDARDHALGAEWKIIRCLQGYDTTGYAFAPLAIRYAEERRDEVCACKDHDCVSGAIAREPLAFEFAIAVPLDEAAAETLKKTTDAGETCARAPDAATIDAAIGLLTALRDRACACPDTGCAQQVKADLEAAAAKDFDVRLAQDDRERLQALGVSLGTCLAGLGVH